MRGHHTLAAVSPATLMAEGLQLHLVPSPPPVQQGNTTLLHTIEIVLLHMWGGGGGGGGIGVP